jgi:hypothetical protein
MRRGIGASKSKIGFDASFYRRTRRLGLEKVCVERFQRIVPIVIAGNRIDRLGEPLEGKIKISFVIMHRSCGIDHVRGYDEKLHVIVEPKLQIARDQ